MKNKRIDTYILSMVCAVIVTVSLAACNKPAQEAKATTAPAATPEILAASLPSNPLKEAYFGEQHMHTAYSLDAYIGGARLTPAEAYHFAKGAEVEVGGVKVQLHKPLDWAAVTDHAEYIGEMYSAQVAGAPGYDQDLMKQLRDLNTLQEREKWFLDYVVKSNRSTTPQHPPFYQGDATAISAWKVILAATQDNYEPGKFTTIPAFEWSCATCTT
jgi:hypothetical protein